MSLFIGYGRSGLAYTTTADGAVRAGGILVTASGGWVELRSAGQCLERPGQDVLSVRVRVEETPDGRARLYAEEIGANGKAFATADAFMKTGGNSWASCLADAVHSALERRLIAGLRPTTSVRRTGEDSESARDLDAAEPVVTLLRSVR